MTWFNREDKRRGGDRQPQEAARAEAVSLQTTMDSYVQQVTGKLRCANHPDHPGQSYYDVLLAEVKENPLFQQSFQPEEQDSAARFLLRQHIADKVKGFAGSNDFDDFITRNPGQLYTEMTHGLDRKLNMPNGGRDTARGIYL